MDSVNPNSTLESNWFAIYKLIQGDSFPPIFLKLPKEIEKSVF